MQSNADPAAEHLRIGFVMLHTSPLDVPGTKDAGGMNVVVRAQAEALARAGHEVTIFTRRSNAEVQERTVLMEGLTVVQLAAGPATLLPKGEHERLMAEFGEALASAIGNEPVDLLHAEHWFSGIAALPVARRLGIPLVQSYHSIAAPMDSPLTHGERPESPGRLAGERRLAHEADLVIAVSEAERATVIERLGGAPDRSVVVQLGVDTELFHPADERDGAARREVMVVGRLHPLKGFDRVIAAIATIPAAARPAMRIVGSPPPDGASYERELHAAVEAHGMGEITVFEDALGREALAERMRETSLVIVPSYSETFGLVALEAAASGVPVVARRVGGLCESVVDGVTGVLVDGDDAAEWGAAIAALIGDPGRRAKLGTQARSHAVAHNWDASASGLAAVYRLVLARHT